MPTDEQIKTLAYKIWERKGYPDGEDQKHYFTAKHLLEIGEKLAQMPRPASLQVSDAFLSKLDEHRGELERAEFLELCLDAFIRESQAAIARSARDSDAIGNGLGDMRACTRNFMLAYFDFVNA